MGSPGCTAFETLRKHTSQPLTLTMPGPERRTLSNHGAEQARDTLLTAGSTQSAPWPANSRSRQRTKAQEALRRSRQGKVQGAQICCTLMSVDRMTTKWEK